MQAQTLGVVLLPSGHLIRPRERPRRGAGRVALGSLAALLAVLALLFAASSPAPAPDARPSIGPGPVEPVADPHGVSPSLLRTVG